MNKVIVRIRNHIAVKVTRTPIVCVCRKNMAWRIHEWKTKRALDHMEEACTWFHPIISNARLYPFSITPGDDRIVLWGVSQLKWSILLAVRRLVNHDVTVVARVPGCSEAQLHSPASLATSRSHHRQCVDFTQLDPDSFAWHLHYRHGGERERSVAPWPLVSVFIAHTSPFRPATLTQPVWRDARCTSARVGRQPRPGVFLWSRTRQSRLAHRDAAFWLQRKGMRARERSNNDVWACVKTSLAEENIWSEYPISDT